VVALVVPASNVAGVSAAGTSGAETVLSGDGVGALISGAASGAFASAAGRVWTAGGTGALGGGITTAAGGRATDCGVMNRGAGFGSAGTTGCVLAVATGAAGFGGATALGGAAGATGRAGAAGCAALCVIAFSTSPGLEMCDRSILGLNSSDAAADAREPRLELGSCSAKYFFTRSASSSSMELECVFFSVTPTFGRTSRIDLLFTSSSLARSLIRILCCITPRFLRYVPSGYAFISILTVWLISQQNHYSCALADPATSDGAARLTGYCLLVPGHSLTASRPALLRRAHSHSAFPDARE
jgi:hypothetical protein